MNDKQLVFPIMYFPECVEYYECIYFSNFSLVIFRNDLEPARIRVRKWEVEDGIVYFNERETRSSRKIDYPNIQTIYQKYIARLITGDIDG